MRHNMLPIVGSFLLAPALMAQPYSYHTSGNEFRRVDHQTNTAIVMTAAGTAVTGLNCVTMTNATDGWVGTVTAPTNIHPFKIAGTTVTFGAALNSNATAGGNIAQIVDYLGFLYFSTQAGAAGGVLQRIPVNGGAVESRLDLSTKLPAAQSLANAVAKVGLKIYVCTFASGSQGFADNQIVEHDPLGAAGNGTVIGTMPKSKFQSSATTNYGIGSVHAHEYMIGNKPHLAVIGVFGDIVIFDVSQGSATVVDHLFGGRRTSATASASNLLNSGHFDSTTNSWVLGTRTASAVERQAGNHLADQLIAGPSGGGTGSVGGTWFVEDPKNDDKFVAGTKDFDVCTGSSGQRLTDAPRGAAVSPNPNFAFAVHGGSGTDNAFLAFGPRIPAVAVLGCDLHLNPIALVATRLTGGSVEIQVPIPANIKVANLFRQWASGGVGPFVLSQLVETNIK